MSLALETRGLTRRFGEVTAVDDLDLTIQGPGVFGFLGANGAGKTTTIRMLVGLLRPTCGEIRLLGQSPGTDALAVRHRLGYLPQDPAFHPWMSGEEYLLHVGELFGLSRKEARVRAHELLERCGLEKPAWRRRVAGWSGGMKQRLGIAQALINRPELVILDEPVSALDPVGRIDVLELVESLGREVTVFMSSHILADIERVCEEVAILDHGKLLVHEKAASLKRREVRPAVELVVRGEAAGLTKALAAAPWVEHLEPLDTPSEGTTGLRLKVRDLAEAELALPKAVVEHGLRLVSLSPTTPSLEDVFISLIDRNPAGPNDEEVSA
ncbi:MAG: ABC transporter ATP-binding protein [Myxococcales bacterium]|jgi:ABC-2 type transport system ATP-binding protein